MIKNQLGTVCLSFLGVFVCLGGAQGAEQTLEPNSSLDKVVITANRIANKKIDSPANVQIISAEEIQNRGYLNVSEALDNVPGCNVLQNGVGSYEKRIMLNGDLRVVVLVDGKRVNNNIGAMSQSTFDASTLPPVKMIDHIEVVKGGTSTLYGADGVGGVVNIITKTLDAAQGQMNVGYGSQGRQDMNMFYGGKEGKTGYLLAVAREKQSYFKYKNDAGKTKHWPGDSHYTQDKVSLKLNQDLTKTTSLTFNYDYSNLDGVNPYSVTYAAPALINKKTNNVALRYDWNKGQENVGYITAYRNFYQYDNLGVMSERTYGLEGQQNFVAGKNNKIILGAEYKNAQGENAGFYLGTKEINNRAVFLQDQWEFAPTWQLNTGFRYDHHSKAGSKTTGSLALNKKFSSNSHGYISWNQVFRAPTIDDLYYYNDMGFWGKYQGNENLQPERGNVWTIGYDFQTSPSTEVGISAFYSNIKDAINWHTEDYLNYYAENVDKEKKRGLEISFLHHLNPNLDLTGSYTYAKAEKNYGGAGYTRDYTYVPNLYRFGISYHTSLWNVALTARGANGLSKTSYGEPRYLTLDLNTRYKISHRTTAYLKLYNLTNAAYAEQAGTYNGQDNYPMPARSFIMGLEYKF